MSWCHPICWFGDQRMDYDSDGRLRYTKALLEALGASSVKGLYEGPKVGEAFLAVPLQRNPREEGYTKDSAIESVAELKAILCTRVSHNIGGK